MDIQEILAKCDHTLLKQDATWKDIKALCDDGLKYRAARLLYLPGRHSLKCWGGRARLNTGRVRHCAGRMP